MAVGFDIEAGLVALSLSNELPEIRIVAVIPFEGMQRRFSASQRARFDKVKEEANEVITLAQNHSPSVYATRNNYLVDNSSAVIAYFTGEKGGTAYTVRRAVKRLLQVINIYNNPQQKLTF